MSRVDPTRRTLVEPAARDRYRLRGCSFGEQEAKILLLFPHGDS